MRPHFALSMALLLTLQCASASTPAKVVESFYDAYLAARPPGLPSGPTLAPLEPFLSDALRASIAAANARTAEFIRTHGNDEKPPYVDGDHFSSVFEGPRAYRIVHTESQADGTTHVRVQFTDDSGSISWEDTVVVKEERGRFVIDDVLFAGAGEFNPPGRLRDRLKE